MKLRDRPDRAPIAEFRRFQDGVARPPELNTITTQAAQGTSVLQVPTG